MKRPDYTGATPEKLAKALFKKVGSKQAKPQKRAAEDSNLRKRSENERGKRK